MKYYLVREEEGGADWDDIVQFQAMDHQRAAETYARKQCHDDSDCIKAYESGVRLQVRESSETGYKLVSVRVSMEPHFSSVILGHDPTKILRG